MHLGPLEVILILAMIILLFGVGRIGKIGGELGKSIREFRKGLEGDEAKKPNETKPSEGSETRTP